MSLIFSPGQTILFQGDSITDAGRDRDVHDSLGNGYAMMAASWVQAACPVHGLTFLNRGISGNRAKDLQDRWQEDCLGLKPDWVSLLIGINDCWRRFDSNDPTSTDAYAEGVRDILFQCANAGIKLIVCEPFVLPTPPDREAWREDLDPKIAVLRRIAQELGARYVPFDGIYAAACTQRDPAFWAEDGVHPSPAGHALMAQAWLKAVGAN